MKIINGLDQRSEEWLSYRKEGIGSSDIVAIMGLNPWKKPLDVYNEKHGFAGINHTNKAMQRGILNENDALLKVSHTLGVELSPCCVEDMERPWMRASLDGYNAAANILVEIKTPTEKNFNIQCMIVDEMHYCQVQWQLLITKAQHAYLYIYSPEKKDGILHFIDPDLSYQEKLLTCACDFWHNNVLIGVAPECKIDDIICIDDVAPLEAVEMAEKLESTLEMIKTMTVDADQMKKKLPDFGDGGSFRIRNIVVKLCTGRKTLDKEAMIKDGIDVSKYEKKGKDYWTVSIDK